MVPVLCYNKSQLERNYILTSEQIKYSEWIVKKKKFSSLFTNAMSSEFKTNPELLLIFSYAFYRVLSAQNTIQNYLKKNICLCSYQIRPFPPRFLIINAEYRLYILLNSYLLRMQFRIILRKKYCYIVTKSVPLFLDSLSSMQNKRVPPNVRSAKQLTGMETFSLIQI